MVNVLDSPSYDHVKFVPQDPLVSLVALESESLQSTKLPATTVAIVIMVNKNKQFEPLVLLQARTSDIGMRKDDSLNINR